jgi:hypothetical protein
MTLEQFNLAQAEGQKEIELAPFQKKRLDRLKEELQTITTGEPSDKTDQQVKQILDRIIEIHDHPKGLEIKEAQEIMKDDFYGPKEVEKAFQVELKDEEIPPITFSREQLEYFKVEGFMLRLTIDHNRNDLPLTIKRMRNMYEFINPVRKIGRLFSAKKWYLHPENYDPFSDTEVPKLRWALVRKAPLTANYKNYQQQEEILEEFAKKHEARIGPDHKVERRRAVETVYDLLMVRFNRNAWLFPEAYDLTQSQLTKAKEAGNHVAVGNAMKGGIEIISYPSKSKGSKIILPCPQIVEEE